MKPFSFARCVVAMATSAGECPIAAAAHAKKRRRLTTKTSSTEDLAELGAWLLGGDPDRVPRHVADDTVQGEDDKSTVKFGDKSATPTVSEGDSGDDAHTFHLLRDGTFRDCTINGDEVAPSHVAVVVNLKQLAFPRAKPVKGCQPSRNTVQEAYQVLMESDPHIKIGLILELFFSWPKLLSEVQKTAIAAHRCSTAKKNVARRRLKCDGIL